MTKVTIDYQDDIKVEYTVPDHIADAVESLLMMYRHTVLEYKKEQKDD